MWRWMLSGLRKPKNRQSDELAREATKVLPSYVSAWDGLTPEQQSALQAWVSEFIPKKNWEGCGGLTLVNEMKIAIAGQIALMAMGWKRPFYFDHVQTILVYPTAFVAPRKLHVGAGLHVETEEALEGEAWYGGPVIISWKDVAQPNRGKPHNLVIHEFAHQLDMLNGDTADGLPPLPTIDRIERWRDVFHEAHQQLRYSCQNRMATVLDCYGRSSHSELFAVACEAFFEAGDYLAEEYPGLYRELSEFFELDSRNWWAERVIPHAMGNDTNE